MCDLTPRVLAEVAQERGWRKTRWKNQSFPDGTGTAPAREIAESARRWRQTTARVDHLSWRDLLTEEVYAAFAESDPARLRGKLTNVAAVAVAWIEDVENREAPPGPTESR